MKLPLLLVDTHGEVTIFGSRDSVSREFEAQDVRDDEYRLFDAAGLEYALVADSDSSPVLVGDPVTGQADFDRVLAIARDYLGSLPARVRSRS